MNEKWNNLHQDGTLWKNIVNRVMNGCGSRNAQWKWKIRKYFIFIILQLISSFSRLLSRIPIFYSLPCWQTPIYVLPLRRKSKDQSHKTKDRVELLHSLTYALLLTRMEDRIFRTKQQQAFTEFGLLLTYSWITFLFVTIIQALKTDLQLICCLVSSCACGFWTVTKQTWVFY